jgi:hypothetical protein
MLLRRLYVTVLVALVSVVAWGQAASTPPNWDDLAEDAASSAGKPHGFGALSRLPSVRIVVYDPVSNSFGFVRSRAKGRVKDEDVFNQDYLDRERLALTTQKVRLLILPYNALTTHLTLTTSNGNGVEFKTLFSQPAASADKGTAAAAAAETANTTAPANAAKATVPGQLKAKAKTNFAAEQKDFRSALKNSLGFMDSITSSNQGAAASRDAFTASAQSLRVNLATVAPKTPGEVLADIDASFDVYRDKSVEIQSNIDAVLSGIHCLHDSLPKTQNEVTKGLAEVDNTNLPDREHPFTLAYDRAFEDVLAEAQARHDKILSIASNSLTGCLQDVDKSMLFEDQVGQLDIALDNAHRSMNLIGILLDKASDTLTNIRSTPPKDGDVKADDWKETIDAYGETLKSLKTFHTGVQKRIDDARTAADALLSPHEDMVNALLGPAGWIQRFIYPPLEDGKSITFAIRRTIIDPKSTTTATVDETNSIELRSATSDLLRFSTGVVKSGFRNPTFKAGPTESTTDSSGKTIMQHQILFDDENNGTTLMGVFVHHYWERRSPLLRPTLLERLVPTFSLGLPLAKSDLLEQVLLGLDWELIPGVELNVGGHFGKSARLVRSFDGKPLHVGDYVPATVDSTAVQSTHYASGVYFGISLNGDAFAALTGNRK